MIMAYPQSDPARAFSRMTGELLELDQRPSVRSRSNLRALIVRSLHCKAKPPLLDFLESCRDGDTLSHPRRGQMLYVHVEADALLVFLHVRRSEEHTSELQSQSNLV